jgi:hypothetical protein
MGTTGKAAVLPQSGQSGNRLVLNYQVRTNDPRVLVFPEVATDLSGTGWASSGITVSNLGTINLGGETLERRSASVLIDGDRKFLRLRVNQSP